MQGAVEQAAARPARDESILPPPTSFWARHEHALLGTISMLVFLAFWETSVDPRLGQPLFTSSPSRIVRTAIDMFADGSILVDMQVSGFEFIVGYGAAIVIGVPLGILMGWYRPGRRGARSVRVRALRHTAHRAPAAGHDLVRHRADVQGRHRVPRRGLPRSW
jgi:hypothetical protein